MTANLTTEYLDALVAKLEYWAKSMLIGGTPLGEHVLSAANTITALREQLELERGARETAENGSDILAYEVTALRAREAAIVAAAFEALTPSGDTKAAYSGEFSIRVYDGEDESGEEMWRLALVDWTTIKAIMSTIKARAITNNAALDRMLRAERNKVRREVVDAASKVSREAWRDGYDATPHIMAIDRKLIEPEN